MTKEDNTKKFVQSLFGASEVKNRIAASAVKLIVADIKVLYEEFKAVKGPGALFFNPTAPENSRYLTVDEIHKDSILSEELMNKELTEFLRKLINIVEKNSGEDALPVIVMVTDEQMTIHLLDLEKMNENFDKIVKDALS